MNDTQAYLDAMISLRKTMPMPRGFKYRCIEEIVDTLGIACPCDAYTFIGRRDLMKACFDNSYKLAKRLGLRYVEGFACGVIPVHHAWCINDSGVVIDPTWEDGTDYNGVVIPLAIVAKTRRRGSCSVLDDWQAGWPALRGQFDVAIREATKQQAILSTTIPAMSHKSS